MMVFLPNFLPSLLPGKTIHGIEKIPLHTITVGINPRLSDPLTPWTSKLGWRYFEVVFPRDRTSWDKDGTSRCLLVPGQRHFPCPAVPLSQDKGRSKCPRTNSSVPGRPGTKLLSQKNTEYRKRMLQNRKMTRFSVSEHHLPVLEHPFLF